MLAMRSLLELLLLLCLACAGAQAQAPAALDPDRLQAEIAALAPPTPVRAEIPWRLCLLEALHDALQQKKPVLIWAYRGDPAEGRC